MNNRTVTWPSARVVISALLLGALFSRQPAVAQDYTFGVEVNGTLCGYADVHARSEGSGDLVVTEKVLVTMTALGSEVRTEVDSTYHVDPSTGRFTLLESRICQGDNEFELRAVLDGDRVRIFDSLRGAEISVPLPTDAILDNPVVAPHLVRDLVERGLESVTYPILDPREAAFQPTTYTIVRREPLELAGRSIDTLVVDRRNEVTGLELRQWLDTGSGMVVKMDVPGGRSIYLADASVKQRVAVANLDASIIQKVDVAIADVQAIEFMRIRAVVEPTGLRVTEEGLNVPGQRFEGTVDGNRVDGVFTIEHPRYTGSDAPPFPPDFGRDPALAPFLQPAILLESDDPVLVEHARSLTAGAKDSWDAAVRLSGWVAENVSYAIPGGVGARQTLETRAGECGAHSLLLAALCRAVSIPARVVWGCMYVPSHGGAFGQHAWTEIYMGAGPGWVPVDSTAFEADFVDSAHVRIGEYQSFSTAINMREMEVLEHRLAVSEDSGAARPAFDKYLGEYAHPGGKAPFVALVRDGSLTVDIPDNVALALRDPDERGRWFAKLTDRVYFTFALGDGGDVSALTLHEIVQMPRRGDPADVPADAPAELRPYFGTYRLAALRADFEVLFDGGRLGVRDPIEKRIVHLVPSGDPGRWIDEYDKNAVSFERNADGKVTALLLDVANRFPRIVGAATPEPAKTAGSREVEVMLTAFHRAAADADGEAWFAHLDPGAVVLGTDLGERWTVEDLRKILSPAFAAGTGWTTEPTAQRVYLTADGRTAWFDEDLESRKYGRLRGTGAAVRADDGVWRIVLYQTAMPVPNSLFAELMEKSSALRGPDRPSGPVVASPPPATAEAVAVRDVLLGYHRAASVADRDAYFAPFAADGIYFGTAPEERFGLDGLKEFTEPYFAGGAARPRTSLDLHIDVSTSGEVAWFDDRLQYGDYGELRCSGVLVRRDGAWRVVQYHLAAPVPNQLVAEFVERIRAERR